MKGGAIKGSRSMLRERVVGMKFKGLEIGIRVIS